MIKKPQFIEINKIGSSAEGYISYLEELSTIVPFEIKRVFWTYYTPESVIRLSLIHI